MFRVLSASSLLLLLLVAGAARADEGDDKRVCLSTYVDAQSARKDGKLTASQHALEQCGRQVCPAVIRDDCVRWLREVGDAMPTVVLSAKGPDGADRTDVMVTMDGQPLATHLDGRPLPVDPGAHVLRFELRGVVPVEQRILMREGEKDRAVVASFAPATAPSPPPSPPVASRAYVPLGVWVLGGVGIASVAVSATFAGLGWFGSPGWTSSQSCRPYCPTGDVDTIKQHFAVADVAGGVAVLSLGAAAVLYVTRPAQPAAPLPVGLMVGPHAATVGWTGAW